MLFALGISEVTKPALLLPSWQGRQTPTVGNRKIPGEPTHGDPGARAMSCGTGREFSDMSRVSASSLPARSLQGLLRPTGLGQKPSRLKLRSPMRNLRNGGTWQRPSLSSSVTRGKARRSGGGCLKVTGWRLSGYCHELHGPPGSPALAHRTPVIPMTPRFHEDRRTELRLPHTLQLYVPPSGYCSAHSCSFLGQHTRAHGFVTSAGHQGAGPQEHCPAGKPGAQQHRLTSPESCRRVATRVRAHFPGRPNATVSTCTLLWLLLCPVRVSAPLCLREARVSRPRTASPGGSMPPWLSVASCRLGTAARCGEALTLWETVRRPSGRTESSREEMAAEEGDGF